MSLAASQIPEELPGRILSVLSKSSRGVAVLVYCGGNLQAYSTSESTGFKCETRVHVGCLGKPMTATLVAVAVDEGRLHFDDAVTDRLAFPSLPASIRPHVEALRIHHLLNHSHGFDDPPSYEFVPRTEAGHIAAQLIVEDLLRVRALAAPGRIFNYSNVGSWLAASILESIYGKTYREILREKVLVPLGLESSAPENTKVCPSTGGELQFTAYDFLALARMHFSGGFPGVSRADPLATLRGARALVHEWWHPQTTRICLGWFDHEDGCFGHDGRGMGDSAAIRFFPASGIAVVVTAAQEGLAGSVMHRLFGNVRSRPGWEPPRPMNAEDWAKVDAKRYEGCYESNTVAIVIDLTVTRTLRARVYKKDKSGKLAAEPHITRYLAPASNNTFFPTQPEPWVLRLLHFAEPGLDQRPRLLHTYTRAFGRSWSSEDSARHPVFTEHASP